MKETTRPKLIITVSLFLILFCNINFFQHVLEVYPLNIKNSWHILSLGVLFTCVNIILLTLVCFKYTTKPLMIILLITSSIVAYFMDTYHIFIDDTMIDNVVKTDLAEALGLMSFRLVLYFFLLGIIPSILIYKINIIEFPLKKSIITRIILIGLSVVIIISNIFLFGNFYASFFREHKPLRFYTNPAYYLYSSGIYVGNFFKRDSMPFRQIGLDAKISPADPHRELVILVIGETARADHFSLNGYSKKNNPLLEKEDVISFKNTWACGTSTASSVPCMFSFYGHSQNKDNKISTTENVLDILQRAGVNVIWLDNNSNSRGVATRIPHVNYKTPDNNPICDIECRDEGMLVNLQTYINEHPQGDIFIVLHQMGNHGPEYFKRYPPLFEKFTPVCKTNQLEKCTREEINNAYDNAILYTDYFLSKTIALLKKNDAQYETSLFYVSDHGESLGEKGLYLHGLPYMIAPDAQKHVPMIMWFGDGFNNKEEINFNALKNKINNYYSHDNIFHTILGLLEVKTAVYDKTKDIIEHTDND